VTNAIKCIEETKLNIIKILSYQDQMQKASVSGFP